MKAESLLLSDVITHTSHSSIILLGLTAFSFCLCAYGCAWCVSGRQPREDMDMKEGGQEFESP